jgi:hypothetical protein
LFSRSELAPITRNPANGWMSVAGAKIPSRVARRKDDAKARGAARYRLRTPRTGVPFTNRHGRERGTREFRAAWPSEQVSFAATADKRELVRW